MLRREVLALLLSTAALPAFAVDASHSAADGAGQFGFAGLDGVAIDLAAYAGRPVLVVNTASRCGFVGQFDGLQALQDRYRAQGLTVIGVPSDSFWQELGSTREVKEFCEVNFEIDFPIAAITDVTGSDAHPFYRWAGAQGVTPRWNFHKILIDGDGRIAGSFTALVEPEAPELVEAIEAALR